MRVSRGNAAAPPAGSLTKLGLSEYTCDVRYISVFGLAQQLAAACFADVGVLNACGLWSSGPLEVALGNPALPAVVCAGFLRALKSRNFNCAPPLAGTATHNTVPHDHDSAHGGAVALCPGARGLAVATQRSCRSCKMQVMQVMQDLHVPGWPCCHCH